MNLSRRGQGRSAPQRATAIVVAAVLLSACHTNRLSTLTLAAQRPARDVPQLQRDINALLAAPALDHGIWGVVVKSLSRNDTLYSINGRKLLMPASNMKIVTLAAAAERLHFGFSYETRLSAAGTINGGTLDGDLIVTGTGDPSIEDWAGDATILFRGWADQLKAAGIQAITGRIVGDDNSWDDQILGPGWAWDDLDKSYATSIGALQFNQNTARATIRPGSTVGGPADVSVAPEGHGLVIRNLVQTGAAGTAASIETRRFAGSPILELRGSLPVGAAPIVRNVSVYNPTLYFVTAFREALVTNGIDVQGAAVDIDDAVDAPARGDSRVLVSYFSQPLAKLAMTMMKNSQNLYAESLLNNLGALAEPAGTATTTAERGRNVVRTVLQGWGISPEDFVIADGSGLSRYNLITPEALVAILIHVARDEQSHEPFDAALPIAGNDGTLAQRMIGTAAQHNAHAKTGAFSNTRALSGYVHSADGELLVFSILANNFGVPPDLVEKTMDAIVVRLAQFSRR